MKPYLQAIANRWSGENCDLVILGQIVRARVAGRLKQFATIMPLDSAIPPVEFSWPTVSLVMNSSRQFRA